MDRKANDIEPCANMNCQRLEKSFVPVVEEEAIEVEYFLAEPKNDLITVDTMSCFDKDGQNKCSETDIFSGGLDDIAINRGVDDMDFGILDAILDEVDEIDDFHATDGLLSPYEDIFLGIDLPEVVNLGFAQFEDSHLDKSSSESNSTGSSKCSGAVALRDSTEKVECYYRMHDQTALDESNGAPRKNCYPSIPVEQMQTSDSQALDDVENDSDPFASGVTTVEGGSDQATKTTSLYRQKRIRKPTRRFIEESSASKTRTSRGKQKNPIINLKEKLIKSGPHDDDDHRHSTRIKALTSIGVSGTQVGSEFRPPRGQPKKQTVVLESNFDEDISGTESENDSSGTESEDKYLRMKRFKGSNDRRNRHKMWTLAEVMNLIDGIAQYGVGRWTDIKRRLFSSSPYRTPMDIRDKWRNLLKASGLLKQRKKEVEPKKKNALPTSVLHRVAELAKIHPYPRDSTAKFARSRPIGAPTSADASEGSQSSFV